MTQVNDLVSVVYFIQSQEGARRIKIGTTSNIKKRFEEIQMYCATELKLLGYILGDTTTETGWHNKFVKFKHHGEWFNPDPELLSAINLALDCGINVEYKSNTIQKNEFWDEELIKIEAEKYKEIHGKYPNVNSGTWQGFDGKNWSNANYWLGRRKNSSLSILLGGRSKPKKSPDEKIKIINNFIKINKDLPHYGTEEYYLLRSLQSNLTHHDLLLKNNLPISFSADWEKRLELVEKYIKEFNIIPFGSRRNKKSLPAEKAYKELKRKRPELLQSLLKNFGLQDESHSEKIQRAKGKSKFNLNLIVPHVAHHIQKYGKPIVQKSDGEILGLKWGRLDALLHACKSYPGRSRGLSDCADLCQTFSVSRLCDEIEENCWKFTIDKNNIINLMVPAIREYYLDWQDPFPDGKPVKRKFNKNEYLKRYEEKLDKVLLDFIEKSGKIKRNSNTFVLCRNFIDELNNFKINSYSDKIIGKTMKKIGFGSEKIGLGKIYRGLELIT